MREILFRGKIVGTDEWWHGDMITDFYKGKTYIHNRVAGVPQFSGNYLGTIVTMCEVIPETVGQYTGLKDKNGTKIFEGDIISYENGNVMMGVTHSQRKESARGGHGIYYNKMTIGFTLDDYCGDFDKMEVIGNIHDKEEV